MKKLFTTLIPLAAIALLFSACNKDTETDEDPYLNVITDSPIRIPAAGLISSIEIDSNVDWSIIIDEEESGWYSFNPSSGSGKRHVMVTVESNNRGNRRAFELKVRGNGKEFPVKFEQLAATEKMMAEPEQDFTKLPAAAGDYIVNVTCNTNWTASVVGENVDWCTIENPTGDGNGSFIVKLDENRFSGEPRLTTIRVSYGTKTEILIATQLQGVPNLTATPEDNLSTLTEVEGKYKVDIVSNSTWKASVDTKDATWVTLEDAEGRHDGSFYINLEGYGDLGQTRPAVIKIEYGGESTTLTLIQTGGHYIKDPAFKAFLLSPNGGTALISETDGRISMTATGVTLQNLVIDSQNDIKDISGIEYLTSLKTLELRALPSVESMDFSKSAALKDLTITNVPATSITFGEHGLNQNLESIEITGNAKIEALSMKELPALQTVKVNNCMKLTSIDLSDSKVLTGANISNNMLLADVNFAECPALTDVIATRNVSELFQLDFSGAPAMKSLHASNSGLSSLKLGSAKFTSVICEETDLPTLDLAGQSELIILSLKGSTKLTTLDIKEARAIETLNVSGCTSLQFLGSTSYKRQLQYLYADNTAISRYISVSGCTALKELTCYNVPALSLLELNNCNALEQLQIFATGSTGVNAISGTEVSLTLSAGVPATDSSLSKVTMNGTNFTKLTLSKNAVIEIVEMKDCTSLAAIVGTDCPELTEIWVTGSGAGADPSTIDVTGLTNAAKIIKQ